MLNKYVHEYEGHLIVPATDDDIYTIIGDISQTRFLSVGEAKTFIDLRFMTRFTISDGRVSDENGSLAWVVTDLKKNVTRRFRTRKNAQGAITSVFRYSFMEGFK